MNKRDFLKLLSLVLLGGGFSACSGAHGSGRDPGRKLSAQKILVIGAGIAGLAAARELKRAGNQVLILEGRERIGGRIWTSHQWPDLPMDLGASWIHGITANPITDIARQLGAKHIVTSYDRTAFYNSSGQLLSGQEAEQLRRISKQVFKRLRKAQDADADTSIRQALAVLEKSLADDPAALRLLNFCLSTEIEHEYAGSAERTSTYWFDNDKAFDGEDVLFAQGYSLITEYLAQGLEIKLAQVVKEIQWQQSEICVHTTNDEFVAERVVITLPLGVLQHNDVRFTPQLPEAKRNAIDRLGMGVLNKCCLRFAEAFWPDDADWLGYVAAQHGEWTDWLSLKRAAQQAVLIGFNAADYGREIETWSDERIVASAMTTLRTMFGSQVADPIDYQITRWASDRFSRGSYSFNALHATPAMRNALAQQLDGRLYFAGEACSNSYFGTVHGAYLSGFQAAKSVMMQ